MIIIIEIKEPEMVKARKHDKKNWKRIFCKITREDKLIALSRLCTER